MQFVLGRCPTVRHFEVSARRTWIGRWESTAQASNKLYSGCGRTGSQLDASLLRKVGPAVPEEIVRRKNPQ